MQRAKSIISRYSFTLKIEYVRSSLAKTRVGEGFFILVANQRRRDTPGEPVQALVMLFLRPGRRLYWVYLAPDPARVVTWVGVSTFGHPPSHLDAPKMCCTWLSIEFADGHVVWVVACCCRPLV